MKTIIRYGNMSLSSSDNGKYFTQKLRDNVRKYCTAEQATVDNTLRRRKDALCMPDN